MSARVGIKWGNAHQSMHTQLGLEPAMRIVAFDDDRRRLDAGLLPICLLDQFDVEFSPLRPAHVHPQQHARPIAAFSAAGAGMHFDIGVIRVRFAGEERFELTSFALGFECFQSANSLSLRRFVAFGLAKLNQGRRVLEVALDLLERTQPVLQHRALAHHFSGDVGIGPEIRIFGFRV